MLLLQLLLLSLVLEFARTKRKVNILTAKKLLAVSLEYKHLALSATNGRLITDLELEKKLFFTSRLLIPLQPNMRDYCYLSAITIPFHEFSLFLKLKYRIISYAIF